MTDYSVTDIKRLVNDGDWHLNEDAVQKLMAGEEVEVLGEMSFGHFSYDIINITDSPPINIELGIYKPCENDTDRDFADNPGFRSTSLEDFPRDVPDMPEWFSPLYLGSEITGSQDFKEKLVEAMVQEDLLSVQKSHQHEYEYLKVNEKGYYQQLGKHYRELLKKTMTKQKLTKQDVKDLMVHYYNNFGVGGDTDKIILQMREDGLTDARMTMVFDKMIEDKLVMPFDYKKDIKFYTDKKNFDPLKILERAAKKQNVKE